MHDFRRLKLNLVDWNMETSHEEMQTHIMHIQTLWSCPQNVCKRNQRKTRHGLGVIRLGSGHVTGQNWVILGLVEELQNGTNSSCVFELARRTHAKRSKYFVRYCSYGSCTNNIHSHMFSVSTEPWRYTRALMTRVSVESEIVDDVGVVAPSHCGYAFETFRVIQHGITAHALMQ